MTRRAPSGGRAEFRLLGERRGRYTIVRTSGRGGRRDERDQWLLIKKRDEAAAAGWDAEDYPASVKTGRTNDEVKDGVPPRFEQPAPSPDVSPDLSMAREERQPDFVPPMMATLTDRPFDDDDWLYEVKWDGYRVEAVVSGGKARIWTRNRVDAATYFPNLAGAAPWIDAEQAIVDGEVVAFDEAGRRSAACRRRPGCARWRWPPAGRSGRPEADPRATGGDPHGLHGLRPAASRRAIAGRRPAGAPQAPAAAGAAAGRAGALRLARGGRRRRPRRRPREELEGSWPSAAEPVPAEPPQPRLEIGCAASRRSRWSAGCPGRGPTRTWAR